jgi:hypothetical protein
MSVRPWSRPIVRAVVKQPFILQTILCRYHQCFAYSLMIPVIVNILFYISLSLNISFDCRLVIIVVDSAVFISLICTFMPLISD